MAAGATYEPIATTTLSSNGTVTFSSIPGTYTDLKLVMNGGITSDYWDFRWRFNSDSATNYSQTSFYADGSAAGSNRTTSATNIHCGTGIRSGHLNSATTVEIMNYKSTSKYKTCLVRHANVGYGGTTIVAGTWRSTSAITSIYIYAGASNGAEANLYAGTTVTLYGIAAA